MKAPRHMDWPNATPGARHTMDNGRIIFEEVIDKDGRSVGEVTEVRGVSGNYHTAAALYFHPWSRKTWKQGSGAELKAGGSRWAAYRWISSMVARHKPFLPQLNAGDPHEGEHAVELALDRRERARRELARSPSSQPAAEKFAKATEAARRAVRKFEDDHGQSETLARGYWSALGGGNPGDPPPEPNARRARGAFTIPEHIDEVGVDEHPIDVRPGQVRIMSFAYGPALRDPMNPIVVGRKEAHARLSALGFKQQAPGSSYWYRDTEENPRAPRKRRISRAQNRAMLLRAAARVPGQPYANPAPQLPAAQLPALALLGDVVELRIASHGGARTLRPAGAKLLASADGKTIVVARPMRTQRAPVPRAARGAGAMFRKWSAFPARRAVRLTLPDKPITVDLGHVEMIRYRSAKWSGRPTLYEHEFTGKNTAIAEAYKSPRLIKIEATPRRVIVTERGIVG